YLSLDVLRCHEGAVQALPDKRQRDSENQAHHKSDGNIPAPVRTDGRSGNQRLVSQADVCGAQARRDGGVLEALEEIVVKRLVGLVIILQQVVLNKKLIQLLDLGSLLIYRLGEKLLTAYGRVIIASDALDDPLAFSIQERLNFLHPVAEFLHLVEIGTILTRGRSVLGLEIHVSSVQLLVQAIGRNEGSVSLLAPDRIVHRLFVSAVNLGNRKIATQLRKPLLHHVLFVADVGDGVFPFIVNQRLLTFLHFGFELVELLLHPRRGLPGRVVLGAKTGLHVILDQRVGHTRRQVRVSTLVADLHQPAVIQQRDMKTSPKSPNQIGLSGCERPAGVPRPALPGSAGSRVAGREPQLLYCFPGEVVVLQEINLSLHIGFVGVRARVNVVEREHLGGLRLDLHAGRGAVHRLYSEDIERHQSRNKKGNGENGVSGIPRAFRRTAVGGN